MYSYAIWLSDYNIIGRLQCPRFGRMYSHKRSPYIASERPGSLAEVWAAHFLWPLTDYPECRDVTNGNSDAGKDVQELSKGIRTKTREPLAVEGADLIKSHEQSHYYANLEEKIKITPWWAFFVVLGHSLLTLVTIPSDPTRSGTLDGPRQEISSAAVRLYTPEKVRNTSCTWPHLGPLESLHAPKVDIGAHQQPIMAN
ncbi:hypothetical protein FISHEDRAFT_60589 [Fistulina hepatica ATCC 64428]|uniref:Uncharacterized protein n=1 Tax=Fistulina hepatica ATCC 64428 TaxID=1128425 RepID=A0A0D7A855_9AGAR|nr:hypothetical protein FISHEDRAFT_60589 [Fistulina hepatica ATCC 64428]